LTTVVQEGNVRKQILAGSFAVTVAALVHSQFITPVIVRAERGECAIPKNWGTLRSGGIALTFEAADGTIHTIDTGNCQLLGTVTRSQ
jgi:hypothetical protein